MKYILFFCILLLQGCAAFGPLYTGTDRVQLLEQYITQEEYSKALTLIADTPADDPQAAALKKKRKEILKKLDKFERRTVSTALKQERSNNWPGAKATYSNAIKKLNNSKLLEEKQEAMLKRFQTRMLALAHEKLIITGEWLKKILPLQKNMHENDPGDIRLQWTYFQIKNEAADIARKLFKAGEQELAEKNLSMAQRLLPLSVKLNSTPESKAAAEQLEKILNEHNKKKRKNRKKIEKKKNKQAIDAFNKAMALGNLTEARKQLARLSPSMKKQTSVELMQERLDKAITTRVEEELSMGESFYRAGEYEQALQIWQNIRFLVPEHTTVKIKIERTEKVINKLNALKKQQNQ